MSMFMNQLSPGDKMSLKGKIFELQKKLNLLDVEQQNTEDYSFHPEITQYKLPNRKDDFINNLNQAEETRKDRFEALKKQLVIERSQDCSFAPQINKRRKDVRQKREQKPVHIRLTEKGQEYQDSAKKRKEDVKLHDFDGKVLFKPSSSQKPRVSKGNMQVEEYLFRDAKDRVEKMDIKRENEKKDMARVASKQKMNKHSALLIKRKSERESREIYDHISSSLPGEKSEAHENSTIGLVNIQKFTIAMLKFFEQQKGSMTFHNNITSASSPYEVADKVWKTLDINESNEVNLKSFLSISIPTLVSGGSGENFSFTPAKGEASKEKQKSISAGAISFFHQYLSAALIYSSKKKKMEKENDSSSVKQKKHLSVTSKQHDTASNTWNDRSPDEDDESVGMSESTDNISISDSMKSYQEKAALSKRIQSYNRVLTDREVLTNNRLEVLKESLIQKEMEECTFQPRISSVAHKLKEKEMSQSQDLGDTGSVGSRSSAKVYDRLYAVKDTVPRSIALEKHEPSANIGLDECTFQPKINHTQYASFQHSTDENSTVDEETSVPQRRQSQMERNMASFFGDLEIDSGNQKIFQSSPSGKKNSPRKKHESTDLSVKVAPAAPRGYCDSIKRIRQAALDKKKKEADEEAFFAVNEERYLKGLEQMAEGPKPFRFRTDERHNEKEKMYAEVMDAQSLDTSRKKLDDGESTELKNAKGVVPPHALDAIRGKTKKINGELKPIRLYVDIKLSGVKNSHIAVADFDSPALLAKDFCKIYGLDSNAEETLSQIVENNMTQNDIPMGDEINAMGYSNNSNAHDSARHRRSYAESTTHSGTNLDMMDDDDFQFYEIPSSPQGSSTPVYDHAF